ncbi:hypothetical protein E2C01_034502 [Portunus trituberculatus]|uniref:Uncharacterized protein n=1 Tax=Portunus trituberculatus TaxID=210409 RepID=A0A5B7F6G3_PORTR|nr:hypothetical protein [Portunus trituberculatus]
MGVHNKTERRQRTEPSAASITTTHRPERFALPPRPFSKATEMISLVIKGLFPVYHLAKPAHHASPSPPSPSLRGGTLGRGEERGWGP